MSKEIFRQTPSIVSPRSRDDKNDRLFSTSESLGSFSTDTSHTHYDISRMSHERNHGSPNNARINKESGANIAIISPSCKGGGSATKTTRTSNSSTYSGSMPCNQSLCSTCEFPTSNSIFTNSSDGKASEKQMHGISRLHISTVMESEADQDQQMPLVSHTDTFDTDANSEDEQDNRSQEGFATTSYCINGLLRKKFANLGSSFGTLLGIEVPVRVIDKIPNEEFLQCSSSMQSSSVSRLPLTPSKQGSIRSISTPTSIRSDGTIPFLPELLNEGSPGQHVNYHEFSAFPHRSTEINLNTTGPELISPRKSSPQSDELLELAANNYSVPVSNPVNDQDVRNILRKASQAELEGSYNIALDCYGKCLDYHTRKMKKSMNFEADSHTQVASMLHHIGVVHWKTGAYDESLGVLGKARSRIEKSLALCEEDEECVTKEQLCDILNTLGRVYSSKADFESAIIHHSESLSILKSFFEEKIEGSESKSREVLLHPSIAKSLICMGNVHSNCGRLSMAMELFKGGLEIQRKIHGKTVDVAATLNAIGSVYEKTGRLEKGMQCYKKARQIYTKQLGGDHVDVAISLNNIGQIYHHVGKYQKAMDSYREALHIMKKVLGESHRNIAATLFNIGLVHVQYCQFDKAMTVFKETLNLQREALGDDHIDVALTLEAIGGIYEKGSRIERALNCYRKGLNIRQTSSSGGNIYVGLALEKIGKCQMNLNGDVKDALHCFEKALKIYRLNGLTDEDPLLWEARKNFVSAITILEQKTEIDDDLIGLDITI